MRLALLVSFILSLLATEVGFSQSKGNSAGLAKNSAGLSLQKTSAAYAILKGFNFSGATLTQADFKTVKADSALFREVHATEADFRGASLVDSDWTAATANNANFSGAKLTRAVFQLANLQRSSFWGADLSRADFSDADLSGCDLRETILFYTVFKKTKYSKDTKFPGGFPENLKSEMIFIP